MKKFISFFKINKRTVPRVLYHCDNFIILFWTYIYKKNYANNEMQSTTNIYNGNNITLEIWI